jgi:hypothetical protein
MKTVVRENGDRPAAATSTRMNAPQGAIALADLLAEEDFADICVITIDWVGDGFTPSLTIFTVKWFIEYNGQRLEHEWNIDLDEAFGQDNMDNGILRQIVHDLREEFHRAEEQRKRFGF